MSCAVFTIIGVLVLAFNKSNKWALYATFGVAIAMLFVASFLAWRDERHELLAVRSALSEKQQELDDLKKPSLIGEIKTINVAQLEMTSDMKLFNYAGSANDNVPIALIWATIKNRGADSIVENYRLTMQLNDGSRVSCTAVRLPPQVTLKDVGIVIPNTGEESSLMEKTASNPIKKGAKEPGLLLFIIDRGSHAQKELAEAGVKFDLSFDDILGNEYHAVRELTGNKSQGPGYTPGIPLQYEKK